MKGKFFKGLLCCSSKNVRDSNKLQPVKNRKDRLKTKKPPAQIATISAFKNEYEKCQFPFDTSTDKALYQPLSVDKTRYRDDQITTGNNYPFQVERSAKRLPSDNSIRDGITPLSYPVPATELRFNHSADPRGQHYSTSGQSSNSQDDHESNSVFDNSGEVIPTHFPDVQQQWKITKPKFCATPTIPMDSHGRIQKCVTWDTPTESLANETGFMDQMTAPRVSRGGGTIERRREQEMHNPEKPILKRSQLPLPPRPPTSIGLNRKRPSFQQAKPFPMPPLPDAYNPQAVLKRNAKRPSSSLADKFLNQSYIVQRNEDVNLHEVTSRKRIHHLLMTDVEIGDPPEHPVEERVILLIGAAGSGKTTVAHAIFNYLLGTQWDDCYRFLLPTTYRQQPAGPSMTEGVMAYKLWYQEGFRAPFTLTIIDTPGFGNLELDGNRLCADIKQILQTDRNKRTIDAVVLVSPSSLARLSAATVACLTCLRSVLGESSEKLILLGTFADSYKPSLVEALKQGELRYRAFFQLNNSALLSSKGNDEDDVELNAILWHEAFRNIKSLLECLLSMKQNRMAVL